MIQLQCNHNYCIIYIIEQKPKQKTKNKKNQMESN